MKTSFSDLALPSRILYYANINRKLKYSVFLSFIHPLPAFVVS